VPAGRVIVNLAPADLPKEGTHYDLPIALTMMDAIGAIPRDAMDGVMSFGELGLDGSLASAWRLACSDGRARHGRCVFVSRFERRRSSVGGGRGDCPAVAHRSGQSIFAAVHR